MKHTILFLAANPSGTDLRALDREANSIQAELRRSGHGDHFEFQTRWAVEPQDLLRGLRELKPTVVHFSGQGGQNGLLFQNASGNAQVVSPAAFAETFRVAGASVKLIVLSACYSEASAEALLEHVECVIGMRGALHDDAARSFAIGFYGALGEHESVLAAYRHGNAALHLEGLSDVERPLLKVRDGFDATQLVLAAVTPVGPWGLPGSHSVTQSRLVDGGRGHNQDTNTNSSQEARYAVPLTSIVTAEKPSGDVQENQRLHHVRWIATGLGASCLVSGGISAVASSVPAKGVLGQLGLGALLITVTLFFDRIPHKELGATLRWVTGLTVILILGLAYASITGVYEAATRTPDSNTNGLLSALKVVKPEISKSSEARERFKERLAKDQEDLERVNAQIAENQAQQRRLRDEITAAESRVRRQASTARPPARESNPPPAQETNPSPAQKSNPPPVQETNPPPAQETNPSPAETPDVSIQHAPDAPWSRDVAPETREAARQLFLEGNRLFRIPLFARAVEKYQGALRLWDHPAIHFNLALAQLNLGQDVEAHATLELALRYGAAPLGANQFQQGLEQLQDLKRRLGGSGSAARPSAPRSR